MIDVYECALACTGAMIRSNVVFPAPFSPVSHASSGAELEIDVAQHAILLAGQRFVTLMRSTGCSGWPASAGCGGVVSSMRGEDRFTKVLVVGALSADG